MKDEAALNEWQEEARARLVEACRSMLAGQLSYFEGAILVCELRHQIRVPEFAPQQGAQIDIAFLGDPPQPNLAARGRRFTLVLRRGSDLR